MDQCGMLRVSRNDAMNDGSRPELDQPAPRPPGVLVVEAAAVPELLLRGSRRGEESGARLARDDRIAGGTPQTAFSSSLRHERDSRTAG